MLVNNLIFAELPQNAEYVTDNGFYTNSFLARSCLILAETLGFASILNFTWYFLIILADKIPMITPGAVHIMIKIKNGVFSGKNLGTIFTQKAVIAAE